MSHSSLPTTLQYDSRRSFGRPVKAFSVLKWRTSALRCAPLVSPVAAASASRVIFWRNNLRNGIDVALLTRLRCLVVLGSCEECSFVFASSTSVPTLLRRLLTPLSAPKSWARLSRACVWCARGPFPHSGAHDFEMQLPQDLDDLEQHALSFQGVCKHRDDQVCMSGRLRVHGCVHLINMIARYNRHAWF